MTHGPARRGARTLMAALLVCTALPPAAGHAGEDTPGVWTSNRGADAEPVATFQIDEIRELAALPGGGVAGVDGAVHRGRIIVADDGTVTLADRLTRASGVASDPTGDVVWLAEPFDRRLSAVAADTGETVAHATSPGGCAPWDVVPYADHWLVGTYCDDEVGRLWEFDGATFSQVDLPDATLTGLRPRYLSVGSDLVWISDPHARSGVAVVDLSTTPPSTIRGEIDERDEIAARPDDSGAFASGSGGTGVHSYTPDLGHEGDYDNSFGAASAVAIAPGGRYLAAWSERQIEVVDATDMAPLGAWQTDGRITAAAVNDAGVLYVASEAPYGTDTHRAELRRIDTTQRPPNMVVNVQDVSPEAGERVAYVGRLTTPDGTPLADQPVSVTFDPDIFDAEVPAVSSRRRTTHDGEFTVWLTAGRDAARARVEFVAPATQDHVGTSLVQHFTTGRRRSHFTHDVEIGDDTVGYGVQVSRLRFGDDGAARVVLTRNDVFADALAGAPLAVGAPLLFTPPDALARRTADEIDRVLPHGREVLVLGGPGAVADSVLEELSSRGYTVRRLFGRDRIATSLAIAEQVRRDFGAGRYVAIARADGPGTAAWADAVSGGAWANLNGVPIVVTPTEGLAPEVEDALVRWRVGTAVLFGGAAALTPSIDEALVDHAITVERLAGADRVATSTLVADGYPSPESPPGLALVMNAYRSDGWVYGLAAAGLAGDLGIPLLYTADNGVPAALGDWLCQRRDPYDLLVLGADTLVPRHVIDDLDDREPC